MKHDCSLLLIVAGIWAVLAVLYATVPMLHMPGYASIWRWGALIFFVLAVAIAAVARRASRQRQEPQ
jgi:membrane protein implicated in regulation of membrane protease activity